MVIVPKGDPRARPGAANPFLPQTPFLRSTAFGDLTLTQLLASMPGLSSSKGQTVLPFMISAMKEAEINTCARAAAFLAQLGTHHSVPSLPHYVPPVLCCVVTHTQFAYLL